MSRCNRRLFSTSSDESSHESPPVKKKKKTSEAEKVDWDAVRGKLEELLQPDNRFNTFDANVVDDIRRETKDEIPLMLHTVDDFAATLLLLPTAQGGVGFDTSFFLNKDCPSLKSMSTFQAATFAVEATTNAKADFDGDKAMHLRGDWHSLGVADRNSGYTRHYHLLIDNGKVFSC